MNMYDKYHPGQEFRYVIHCNYSGLGWLDISGKLEKGVYEPSLNRGYRHVLWIPLSLKGCRCRGGVNVGTDKTQKIDIRLMCYHAMYYSNGFLEGCF